MEGTVSGQMITGPEQLAIKPETVNLGNSINAACSSRELLPSHTLSIAWTIDAVDLGECRTVNPGFLGMVCDEGINITIPYADGITPYAISRISFTPQILPTRLRCTLANGLNLVADLIMAPTSMSSPPKVNTCQLRHIQCANPLFDLCNSGFGTGQCVKPGGGAVNETCSVIVFPYGFSGSYKGQTVNCNEEGGCEAVNCPADCINNPSVDCQCVAEWGLGGFIRFKPTFCLTGTIDGTCHQQYFRCSAVNFNFCHQGYGTGLCIRQEPEIRNCTINNYPNLFNQTINDRHISCANPSGCESIACTDNCYDFWQLNSQEEQTPCEIEEVMTTFSTLQTPSAGTTRTTYPVTEVATEETTHSLYVPSGSTVQSPDTTNWPWWGTVAVTGSAIAGSIGLGALLVMTKHAYNHYMRPDKEDMVDRLIKKFRKRKQRDTADRIVNPQLPSVPMPSSRNPLAFGSGGGSNINVDPVLMQDNIQPNQQHEPQYELVGPAPYERAISQVYARPQPDSVADAETAMNAGHQYEVVDPATGAQVQAYAIVPVPQPNPYEQPADGVHADLPNPLFLHQQPVQNVDTLDGVPLEGQGTDSAQYQNIQSGVSAPTTGLEEIHQQPQAMPDELDGVPVHLASEEPWYANTNPGVVASAPIYTELNKPSARRALRCMEAMQSQQPGADPLGCVGPGQNPTYFHAMIQLEGVNPFTRLGKLKLKALAKGFDLVFRGMEAVDSYVYDFPLGHPKRTRVHTQHVSETLYGEHLSTVELFDSRIGDMEDPVIAFCNAMGNNVWHAFLVFRNSRTDEYNTLHIRQGSYYPEYMDKAATERYFMYEDKRIVGAFSLAKSAELYGATLDLKLLRDIFMQRSKSKEMKYRIRNQNCMTFSMLAFWATNFDWAAFLKKMGLANLQSPYHILQALAGSTRNRPAIHSQENNLLPDWLAELNQTDE